MTSRRKFQESMELIKVERKMAESKRKQSLPGANAVQGSLPTNSSESNLVEVGHGQDPRKTAR